MTLSLQTKTYKPPRILIYGVHGLGKSTFGSLAPNPVFIQTEDGLDSLNVPAYPLAQSFPDVMRYIEELANEKHDFKTLVVDSVDWLERLIFVQVAKEKNVNSIEDIGYGKGYMMALDLWNEYINGLNFLRESRDMMIIQTAHAEIKRFENPETDSYDRYNVKLHKKASELLLEHSDIVLFANYFTMVKKEKEGFKDRKRAFGSGDRILYTNERPAATAKNRYGLPNEINFTKDGSYWNIIASHVPYFSNADNNTKPS